MKQFNNLREETLLEKLKASDPTGKWIHDFVHSDNPKFAGKSKKERIRMALGASYGAKRNEEVEQVDELKKTTMASYVTKASINAASNALNAGGNKSPGETGNTLGKIANRLNNIKKAANKLAKEEVEQQDEGMMDTVKTVAKKVGKALTGGSDEDQLKNLQKKMGVPQTGKKPEMKEEADICPVCETDPCICEHGQHIEEEIIDEAKPGLYANIHAKRKRIAAGSGERMRKPGSKGAPTAQAFKDAAKTVKEDSEVEEMVAPNAPVHTQLSFNNLRMKTDKKYVDKLKTAQGKTLPPKEKDTLH